jgi:hypothetical protein
MYQLRPYNPATGRFIQHDPSGEGGGRNLYGMLNNDSVNSWDYLGLWEGPYRKGKRWATAIAQDGDTLETLAQLVGLNASEATKWLKKQDGSFFGANDKIRPGCRYKVPNVYFITMGNTSSDHWKYFRQNLWGLTLDYYTTLLSGKATVIARAQGFLVGRARPSTYEAVTAAFAEEGIYKWLFIGHGVYSDQGTATGYLLFQEDVIHPADISSRLKYKVNEVILWACGAGAAATSPTDTNTYPINGKPRMRGIWMDLVSENGAGVQSSMQMLNWDDSLDVLNSNAPGGGK